MKKEFNKNIPNRLTMARIIISLFVIVFLLFPFDMVNISFKKFLINGSVVIDVKLLIAAILFVIASVTDFLDGYLARKYDAVTDFGKVMDAIADKILVNGILIILSGQGFISPVIPVIIILRDTVVNTIKMVAGNNGSVVAAIKTGKFKTAFLMIGITLKLLGNFPLGLVNISLDDFFLITATVLSLISGVEYFNIYKKYFINK
ncbi:MAG: CDP-diacylglycerol--glycerol-3-phosphate 3-phosphatidyltransferase [Bacilli bacterium]|nr:CDP-diacylglycerol--glycerol-3-phosphate 3-phosphatidyltransferase [Bacilli bacterium]